MASPLLFIWRRAKVKTIWDVPNWGGSSMNIRGAGQAQRFRVPPLTTTQSINESTTRRAIGNVVRLLNKYYGENDEQD